MSRTEQVEQLTNYMAHFVAHIGKKLPDDIIAKLDELAEKEDSPLSKVIYQTMKRNQDLAVKLNRPSCQDTGVLQFWVKCGTKFPLIDDLEVLLKEAVVRATVDAPLRHNSVETFDEYNTGKNVGKGTPTVFWDIVPNSDKCEIYAYMAGGGCTLPGKAMVLMPGAGGLNMSRTEQVEQLTNYMAHFVAHIGKKLPDDIIAKLDELAEKEDSPLSKVIYQTMKRNQDLAVKLNRPSCQDTGVLQFWVKCGTKFPLIDDLEVLLKEAVVRATVDAPLRHNSVETFDEYNTGKNVGKGTPTVFWDIVPNSDKCEIYAYMAGGGCTLPGKAMVLMPGAGYEGVTRFVLDVMTSYGLNACPPLLVGVGVATSVETAALLSKKALMRPLGSHNENERAASMEKLLEDGINEIGLGPQGMGGKYSVMGVHIENTARHPSTIGVAVNVGCWSHRRGHIIFDKDLNYTITTHSGVTL